MRAERTEGPRGHVPRATYRLQLHGGFTLDDARQVVDHLRELGVEDLYLSPILTVEPGATHGYHVTDPTQVNPELGGDGALARLHGELAASRMGILLDIVPNHLAASVSSPWWTDVLRRGRSSAHAHVFDIDWEAAAGRVVLPVLGAEPDEAIAAGDLVAAVDEGGPHLRYHDTRFPVAPESEAAARELAAGPAPEDVRALLDTQHYELASWRTGSGRRNYRRFFDITDLVGVRVEDPAVFAASHRRLLDLVADGTVRGVRVDHVDGLRDPTGYLRRLRAEVDAAARGEPPYLVVEDILEGVEPLPNEWPVDGTTGYEFLVALHGWLVDRAGLDQLRTAYEDATGVRASTPALLRERKHDVVRDLFAGEVDALNRRLSELARRVPDVGDLDVERLRAALVAVTVALPVYRTYTRDLDPLRIEDRAVLERALAEVRDLEPHVDGPELVFVERVLTLDLPVGLGHEVRDLWLDVVLRWQQLTGPAMAKGFEDTTFYVRNHLIALNEVGVDAHGIDAPPTADEVHDRLARRAQTWPRTMNATSSHDTKRSEDVRARLLVLADVADEWVGRVARWSERTALYRDVVGGIEAPDANERWLLFQTLVGMWPLEGEVDIRDRIRGFVTKGLREAKVHSSWLDPDEAYEAAVVRFVDAALDDAELVAEVAAFVERIALPGVVNSLAQVVAKLAGPGVPDLYQGTELWDWSLVDPDNRRPVDFALRRRLLDQVSSSWREDPVGAVRAARESWRDGRLKLLVTWRLLQARREDAALFIDATYDQLRSSGARAGEVVGFARRTGGRWAAALFARGGAAVADPSVWPVGETWASTTVSLPGSGPARDVISGAEVEVVDGAVDLSAAFAQLPVALIVGPA